MELDQSEIPLSFDGLKGFINWDLKNLKKPCDVLPVSTVFIDEARSGRKKIVIFLPSKLSY
jgi:hypothetical protein